MNRRRYINIRCEAFRFRRYSRAKYAVFNSLHRVVTIGRLATYIADRELLKSVGTLICFVFCFPLTLFAQDDNDPDAVELSPVQVTAPVPIPQTPSEPAVVLTAEDLAKHTVSTLSDVVALAAGVDMRVRGVGDMQGDLSMRGGTFDQMLILLNGINLTDAQTGHHNLDIPIDVSMVERVELLTPSMLLARGIVAFCGAVNIVVGEEWRDRLLAEISGGSYGTVKASVLAARHSGAWCHTAAATYGRSDGYMRNTDYRLANLYLQSVRGGRHHEWRLQLGGQAKDFGSQAFYSTTYPDQFEATRTLNASVTHSCFCENMRVETSLYGRLHSDRFELFREGVVEPASWYSGHNHHLSDIVGLRSRMLWRVGRQTFAIGAGTRHEGIVSNVLGEPSSGGLCRPPSKYDHSAARLSQSLFGGYHVSFGKITFGADLLGCYNSAFGFNHAASADMVWRPAAHWGVTASASRTYRLPSFTDLYYQSVNQMANPDLNAERSNAFELGAGYRFSAFRFNATAYYRAGRGIIDWVRRPDTELWYSTNHTRVDAFGAELLASWRAAAFVDNIEASYSYCSVLQDAGEYLSAYALDYLRHKGVFSVTLAPARLFCADTVFPLRLKCDLIFRHREGGYIDAAGSLAHYGGVLLANVAVEYPLRRLVLFMQLHNLTDRSYCDHGGVPQPGITFLAGVKWR